jgi:methyl-accepting chemotaxis protein/ABC-type sugar transport system substrate-binding protein
MQKKAFLMYSVISTILLLVPWVGVFISKGYQGLPINTILIAWYALFAISNIIYINVVSKADLKAKHYSQIIHELNSGNLTKDYSNLVDEENNEIVQYYNKIQEFVKSTKRNQGEVSNALENLINTIKEIVTFNNHVSDASNAIASGSTEQAVQSEQCLRVTEEISKKIEELAGNAQEILNKAENAKVVCEGGNTNLSFLLEKTTIYSEVMEKLIDRIDRLFNGIRNISNIADALTNISKQTNLLSLNAAIEAAKAGDAGKGFVVVASEVRKLAEFSQNSAREIGNLINATINELVGVKNAFDETKKIFAEQREAVTAIGQTIKDTGRFAADSIDAQVKYYKEFEQLSILRDKLIDFIGNIAAVAEESAASTQEVASLTMQESNSTNSLADMAEDVSAGVDKLGSLLGEFEIALSSAEKKKVAIVYNLDHPFWDATTNTAITGAKKYGIEVSVYKPRRVDADEQIRIVEDILNSGIDGIAIAPIDNKKLTPVINRAIDSGVKVICIGEDAPDSKRMGLMDTNMLESCELVADTAAKAVMKKGRIMVIRYKDCVMKNTLDRENGFINGIRKYPGIGIVEIYVDPNLAGVNPDPIFDNALKENPDVNLLYCTNVTWGMAAASYLDRKGIKNKKLITIDGSIEIIDFIKKGVVTAAFAQRPFIWGELLVKWLSDAFKGKEIPKYKDSGLYEINKVNYNIFEKNF